MKNNNIAIIGSGAFACAIYSTLKDVKNNNISMFFHDRECYEFVLKNGRHNKMNCNFDKETLITNDLQEVINNKNTIFLCCIFSVARDVVDKIVSIIGNIEINIVICCKGMLEVEPFFLCDYIKNKLPKSNVFVFSGGSFADEMCKKQNTFINLACKNENNAKELCNIFDNFLHINTADKIYETEFFGAIKNVMAIYCGYISQHNSTNEIIGNLTEFIQEVGEFFDNIGFDKNTIFSQAGIGDIMLTCLSGKSRNRTFGELLGSDLNKAKDYLKTTTIEGFDAIKSISKFCDYKKCGILKLEELYLIVKDMI